MSRPDWDHLTVEAITLLDRIELDQDSFPFSIDLFIPGPEYDNWKRDVLLNRKKRTIMRDCPTHGTKSANEPEMHHERGKMRSAAKASLETEVLERLISLGKPTSLLALVAIEHSQEAGASEEKIRSAVWELVRRGEVHLTADCRFMAGTEGGDVDGETKVVSLASTDPDSSSGDGSGSNQDVRLKEIRKTCELLEGYDMLMPEDIEFLLAEIERLGEGGMILEGGPANPSLDFDVAESRSVDCICSDDPNRITPDCPEHGLPSMHPITPGPSDAGTGSSDTRDGACGQADVVERLHRLTNFYLPMAGKDFHSVLHDAIAEIQRLREDYEGCCKTVRHLEDRVREWRDENTKLREALERIQKLRWPKEWVDPRVTSYQIQEYLAAESKRIATEALKEMTEPAP